MMEVVGGRLKRKGAYAYSELIHTGVQQKHHNVPACISLSLVGGWAMGRQMMSEQIYHLVMMRLNRF